MLVCDSAILWMFSIMHRYTVSARAGLIELFFLLFYFILFYLDRFYMNRIGIRTLITQHCKFWELQIITVHGYTVLYFKQLSF